MNTIDMPSVWPTVVHMLRDSAKNWPDSCALVCDGTALSYAEYWNCVQGLADKFRAMGFGNGSRIAILLENSIDHAIAAFGIQASGAQLVALNPSYTTVELEPILVSAAPDLLIAQGDMADRYTDLLEHLEIRALWTGSAALCLTEWRNTETPKNNLALPEPNWLSTLQFTGGTTGRPKGVELTHKGIATNVSQREALLPTDTGKEKVLVITPLFHVYAASMGLYLAAYSHSTLVILPRYRPDLVLQAITENQVTVMLGSPTIYSGLLAYEGTESTDLTSLNLCISGSAPLPVEVLHRWEETSGCPICEGYGQTESGPVLTFNPRHGNRKAGSVGLIAPKTTIQIVNKGQILPVGEVGEIRVRGPQVMQGYRNLPTETNETIRDGWLYTGDLGEMDEDGFLFIRGRIKDIVIVGGFNVYPAEVEAALYKHNNVTEAAVFGIPDPYRGEMLIAGLVLENPVPEGELKDHIARLLTRYKWPAKYFFITDMPKTTVGKIDKNTLRKRFLKTQKTDQDA